MPYIERTDEEIIGAWAEWLKEAKDPDGKNIYFGARTLSLRELVEGMKNGDADCLHLGVECARTLSRTLDQDPVQSFTRQ